MPTQGLSAMQKIALFSLVAMLVLNLPAQAQDRVGSNQPSLTQNAVGGPQSLIYVVSGITDFNGGNNLGIATTFHCTNASTTSETLHMVVRSSDGTVLVDVSFGVLSSKTFTVSTHQTNIFNEDGTVTAGTAITQGLVFIFSTTQFLFCSAMIMDAAASNPVGVALHMVRFNAVPGTAE
jgi:hypothetical protein